MSVKEVCVFIVSVRLKIICGSISDPQFVGGTRLFLLAAMYLHTALFFSLYLYISNYWFDINNYSIPPSYNNKQKTNVVLSNKILQGVQHLLEQAAHVVLH